MISSAFENFMSGEERDLGQGAVRRTGPGGRGGGFERLRRTLKNTQFSLPLLSFSFPYLLLFSPICLCSVVSLASVVSVLTSVSSFLAHVKCILFDFYNFRYDLCTMKGRQFKIHCCEF